MVMLDPTLRADLIQPITIFSSPVLEGLGSADPSRGGKRLDHRSGVANAKSGSGRG
jgi:hypothetical protein